MIEHPPSGPEWFPNDADDDVPERLWLRRLMKIIYIIVVLMVIAGLITMFFPWERVDIPFDPPFRFPERI